MKSYLPPCSSSYKWRTLEYHPKRSLLTNSRRMMTPISILTSSMQLLISEPEITRSLNVLSKGLRWLLERSSLQLQLLLQWSLDVSLLSSTNSCKVSLTWIPTKTDSSILLSLSSSFLNPLRQTRQSQRSMIQFLDAPSKPFLRIGPSMTRLLSMDLSLSKHSSTSWRRSST